MAVTTRTLHERLLFRPTLELNEIVVGELGRAQAGLYAAEINGGERAAERAN